MLITRLFLGSKDEFTPALWALAVEHQISTARKRASVGDGALWVWNIAEDVCSDVTQIVDWFHAAEHLSDAAHAPYPDEKDAKKRITDSKPTKITCIWDVFIKSCGF